MLYIDKMYYPHTLWISLWKDWAIPQTELDMTGATVTCLFFNQYEIIVYYQYVKLLERDKDAYYLSKCGF